MRLSAWEWQSLDTDFIDRATDRGNLPSAFDTRARLGEVAAFAKITSSDTWPLILYGKYVRNFTADPAVIGGFPVDEEDTAWSSGFEIGSSSRWVELGVGYFHIEADSVVAQFTDSDLMDGFTNRRGWLFYVSKMLVQCLRNLLAFGRRCIPARFVVRRLNIPDIRPPRALRAGRIAGLGAQDISETLHWRRESCSSWSSSIATPSRIPATRPARSRTPSGTQTGSGSERISCSALEAAANGCV